MPATDQGLRAASTQSFVTIMEAGFTGDGDALVKQVADSTQGFSLVLASLKALLEHDVRLNLEPDRYPKGALTSTRSPDGGVTAEIARRQGDGTWLWVVDLFSIA